MVSGLQHAILFDQPQLGSSSIFLFHFISVIPFIPVLKKLSPWHFCGWTKSVMECKTTGKSAQLAFNPYHTLAKSSEVFLPYTHMQLRECGRSQKHENNSMTKPLAKQRPRSLQTRRTCQTPDNQEFNDTNFGQANASLQTFDQNRAQGITQFKNTEQLTLYTHWEDTHVLCTWVAPFLSRC